MRAVIIVGHSQILQGATNSKFNLYGEIASEFNFNNMLANKIKNLNVKNNIELIIEYRDTDYEALPNEVNVHDADLVISLHCNAFNTRVKGCETLYYKHTKVSDKIAVIMQNHLCEAMQNQSRGIKPREHNRALKIYERGAYLMKYVKAPCVICEPFFIDNDDELSFALENINKLALAYLRGIEDSLAYLEKGD